MFTTKIDQGMDITQLLSGGLGQQVINGIGNQTGTSEQETSSVINAACLY